MSGTGSTSAQDLDRALAQVSEIREHLSRAELFRAYRARTLLGIATLALGGAGAQTALFPARTTENYLGYWLCVAAVSVSWVALDLWRTRQRLGPRASTGAAIGQFLPALAAGALTTLALWRSEHAVVLPGLWAVLFGLGLAASRPFLAGRLTPVIAWFLVAGGVLIGIADGSAMPSPWWMGSTFGIGCALIAAVLWREEQR